MPVLTSRFVPALRERRERPLARWMRSRRIVLPIREVTDVR